PCYPGEAIEKALDDRLRKIMNEYGKFRNQHALEQKYRDEALLNENSMEKLSDWESNYTGLDDREKAIGRELTAYMKDVAKAYRLPTQIGDERDITVGAFDGVKMTFAPKVIFDDIYIEKKKDPRNPNKTLTYARDYRGDAAAASTIANGDIVIRAGSFEWQGRAKAGIVASYLYHESVHFRHMTIKSEGYKKEWSEALAYTAVTNFQDSVFMLEEDFKRHNAQMAAKNRDKLAEDKRAKELWKQKGGVLRGQKIPAAEPDLLTDAIQDDDDWRAMAAYAPILGKVPAAIKAGQAELKNRVRREREERGNFDWRVQAEINERFGTSPPPPPGGSSPSSNGSNGCPGSSASILPLPCAPKVPMAQPRYVAPPSPQIPAVAQPVRPAQPVQAWTSVYALNLLAEKGCSDPWSISQPDLDRHWAHLLVSDGGRVVPLGLQGCQDRLYRALSEMVAQRNPSRMTQEIFARTAEAARNPNPVQTTDEFPDIPGQQSPVIPTCRYHKWCESHLLNKR
ncbi:MAG: hypothetical protein FD126_1489, partial [Elusimicrobia bacterium]